MLNRWRNDTYALLPENLAFIHREFFRNGLLHDDTSRETVASLRGARWPGARRLPQVLPDRPVKTIKREMDDPVVAEAVRLFLVNEQARNRLSRIVDVPALSDDILVSILPLIYMRYADSRSEVQAMLPFTYEMVKACQDAHVARGNVVRYLLCSTGHLMPCSRRSTFRVSCTGWRGWSLLMFGVLMSALSGLILYYVTSVLSVLNERFSAIANSASSFAWGAFNAGLGVIVGGMLGHFETETANEEIKQISRYADRIQDAALDLVRLRISVSASDQALCGYLMSIDSPLNEIDDGIFRRLQRRLQSFQSDFEIMTTQADTQLVDKLFFPLEDAITYIYSRRRGGGVMQERAFRSHDFCGRVRRVEDGQERIAREEAERVARMRAVVRRRAAVARVVPGVAMPDVGARTPILPGVAPGAVERLPVSMLARTQAEGLERDLGFVGVSSLESPAVGTVGRTISVAKASFAQAMVSDLTGQAAGGLARQLGYCEETAVTSEAVAAGVASVAYQIFYFGLRPDAFLALAVSQGIGSVATAVGVDPRVTLGLVIAARVYASSPIDVVVGLAAGAGGVGVSRTAGAMMNYAFGAAPAAAPASSARTVIAPGR